MVRGVRFIHPAVRNRRRRPPSGFSLLLSSGDWSPCARSRRCRSNSSTIGLYDNIQAGPRLMSQSNSRSGSRRNTRWQSSSISSMRPASWRAEESWSRRDWSFAGGSGRSVAGGTRDSTRDAPAPVIGDRCAFLDPAATPRSCDALVGVMFAVAQPAAGKTGKQAARDYPNDVRGLRPTVARGLRPTCSARVAHDV